jgi:hypothetical protein
MLPAWETVLELESVLVLVWETASEMVPASKTVSAPVMAMATAPA